MPTASAAARMPKASRARRCGGVISRWPSIIIPARIDSQSFSSLLPTPQARRPRSSQARILKLERPVQSVQGQRQPSPAPAQVTGPAHRWACLNRGHHPQLAAKDLRRLHHHGCCLLVRDLIRLGSPASSIVPRRPLQPPQEQRGVPTPLPLRWPAERPASWRVLRSLQPQPASSRLRARAAGRLAALQRLVPALRTIAA